MIPLIPFAPLLLLFGAIATAEFLRQSQFSEAPKPQPKEEPYTPPFLGGQCDNTFYLVFCERRTSSGWSATPLYTGISVGRKVTSVTFSEAKDSITVTTINGTSQTREASQMELGAFELRNPIVRDGNLGTSWGAGYTPDQCGDPPNPNEPPSIPEDGLFTPQNEPPTEAAIVVAPALPLVLVAAILAGAKAALEAAIAASEALAAIKKVAEALKEFAEVFDKLKEFLDEWEKNRPKKRNVSRQTYGEIKGDGAIDFFFSGNDSYIGLQLDVVITDIPLGFGKYFGNFSPNRYRYKELGYIAFYSNTQGIIETRSIEYKRSSFLIPPNAIGFVYHLGLDDAIKGFAFATFSVEQNEGGS